MFHIEEIPCQLKLKFDILALGLDTRQRISWVYKGRLFSLGPKKDFVDLSDFYGQAVHFLKKKFDFKPKIITFDPHPFFVSCAEAPRIKKKYFPGAALCPVFHHLAHVAHFGIEEGPNKKFIGLAFDGTGFGQDRNIWGGEFFVYGRKHFRRVAHFDYQALPGNEKAIREPWRIAFALLYKIYGKKIYKERLGFLKDIPEKELRLIQEMAQKSFNTPQTSSVGRLFDAVAALLDIRIKVKKEAEAAVALEKSAAKFKGAPKLYSFGVKKRGGLSVIDVLPLFKDMIKELRQGKPVPKIAYQFHVTLAQIVYRVCVSLRSKYCTDNVYFSGGVFMNDILTKEIRRAFLKSSFHLYFAKRPTTTDLGVSQGQIAAFYMGDVCV